MAKSRPPLKPAITSRALLRQGRYGSLGTVRHGMPHVSLVAMATDQRGQPLFLLSDLARHVRNLGQDSRCSVLVTQQQPSVWRMDRETPQQPNRTEQTDPLTQGRVTLTGHMALVDPGSRPQEQERFLARHPDAVHYAHFTDFKLYRLHVDEAHLVAGFGEIHDLHQDQVLVGLEKAEAMGAAEQELLDTLNAQHPDMLKDLAHQMMGLPQGQWRLVGLDCEGFDLADGNYGWARHQFREPLRNPTGLMARLRHLLADVTDSHNPDNQP
ncbi:MAG: pyridoxamine 5'-phosphate oxidase family protein [Pseudomonadota bacterium]